ncbi:MAG: end-binding protein Ku [Thermoleophilia bacterium]|jgi:DNA end-binding protein Ku|nr:end-binding protein Ku [Thermoleophilia bacterium]
MARAIWSGSITFGLISLPVKAYTATSKQRIDFDLLHDEDGAKLQYRRVCPVHDEVVEWDHVIKGYEIEPGKYVTFTKDELAALQPDATHTIDIEDFVRLEEIDPMYFDTPYFLVPNAGAKRAYALLHAVMVDANVVAIARVVLRTRERLVAIRPLPNGALSMEALHYANEVREVPDTDGDAAPAKGASEREIAMARTLVDELTVDFDPSRYTDTWHDQVMERIEQKAAGKVVQAPKAEDVPATPANDIMAALEASLAAARAKRGEASAGGAKKKSAASTTAKRRTGAAAARTTKPRAKSSSSSAKRR